MLSTIYTEWAIIVITPLHMHKHKQTDVGKKIYAYRKNYLPTCKISAGNCNANVSFRFHSLFKVVSKGQ